MFNGLFAGCGFFFAIFLRNKKTVNTPRAADIRPPVKTKRPPIAFLAFDAPARSHPNVKIEKIWGG
ncbi:MAG: hypothetical protein LBH00_04270 [Planctomycetaceae bacterium]|nr:hypothetical protein [Planctomycetaceae bacterium]